MPCRAALRCCGTAYTSRTSARQAAWPKAVHYKFTTDMLTTRWGGKGDSQDLEPTMMTGLMLGQRKRRVFGQRVK